MQLTDEDYRVFLLNSYPNARIICEVLINWPVLSPAVCTGTNIMIQAYKRNFLYPKYLWLAYGWYAQASWTNSKSVNCSEEQLSMVLENGISVEVFPIPDDRSMTTVSGLVRSFIHCYSTCTVSQVYKCHMGAYQTV